MPSGEKATLDTPSVCPSKVRSNCPSVTRQSRTVPPTDPEARRVPSGEKATLRTEALCPPKVRSNCPSVTRQSRTVPSRCPEASRVPSGEKATLNTACSVSQNAVSSKVSTSYIYTPMEEARANNWPLGDQSISAM